MLPTQKITADWGLMTSIKLRLIMMPAIAALMIATACGASAQQPGFLDSIFGNSDRVGGAAEPVQSQVQGERREGRSNELMVRLERLDGQIRQLTGAIEELQHRNQLLEAQIQEMRGGVARAPAPAPPMTAPAGPARPSVTPGLPPPSAAQMGRRSDVFDPAQNPNAPGAPRVLGSPSSTASLPPVQDPQSELAPPEVSVDPGAGAPLDLSTLSGVAAADPSLAPPGTVAPSAAPSATPARRPGSGGAQVATLPPSDSPKDNYDLAYGYVLRKDYALAEDGFRSFVVRFPHDRLAPDAHYWLGESLFQRQQFRDAAESFLTVSTKYETTGKAPEALLRLGQSLAALGEKEAACASLGEVSRKYPRASVAVKQGVDREQKRVRC
jgi:tol-pal system protein YbgF